MQYAESSLGVKKCDTVMIEVSINPEASASPFLHFSRGRPTEWQVHNNRRSRREGQVFLIKKASASASNMSTRSAIQTLSANEMHCSSSTKR